ncbi:LysE family translocator [Oerskovia jenensis]|uniref:Threonine/homoserine/homoserine lactone efflux protein n=1 Tax=Oerskovia jenensis TaxID=162169 RepID=A0ABS2LCI8_9CELL|nr:LysE family translocator [Oerskovia jenensis]MBM7478140.1 threonine/homoserine/homoserine lactone efflux protein [Oerskovia jenensis]
MSVATIATFWLVSLLFVVTPGADWAYAITAGLRHRSVLPAVGGMLAGHLATALVVAAGVGVLVSRSPALLTVLTLVGAAYIGWLGVTTLVRPGGPVTAGDDVAGSWVRQAAKGLGTSGLNPKVLLLFLALLPQFTDPAGRWPVGAQIAVLGAVHMVGCAVVYLLVAFGARHVLRSRPGASQVVTRLSGVAMLLIGAALVLDQVVG